MSLFFEDVETVRTTMIDSANRALELLRKSSVLDEKNALEMESIVRNCLQHYVELDEINVWAFDEIMEKLDAHLNTSKDR